MQSHTEADQGRTRMGSPRPTLLKLSNFLPYRLAILSEQIARTIAQIYTDRFDLTRHEWRVLAALADRGPIAAKDVLNYTTLDKMTVSRAVAMLEEKCLLTRTSDPRDRRHKTLHLTAKGHALHAKLTPLVLAREHYLLDALSPEDRAALDRILDTLLTRARELEQRG
jgi:DNA-binding MarR family transcriptional regulator